MVASANKKSESFATTFAEFLLFSGVLSEAGKPAKKMSALIKVDTKIQLYDAELQQNDSDQYHKIATVKGNVSNKGRFCKTIEAVAFIDT